MSQLCLALVLLCIGHPASSAGIPTLNLTELIDSADMIIVGRVREIREVASGTVEIDQIRLPAKVLGGNIIVTATLRGDAGLEKVPLQFSLPITPGGDIGYRGIPNESYRLIFLKRSGQNFDFANPYYPSFPAVAGTPVQGDGTVDQVVNQLAATIQSPQVSSGEKMELLFALRGSNSPILVKALRKALTTSDKVLQLSIAAALLERNDLSALAIGKDALVHPDPNVPGYLLVNLSSAISAGLTDEHAVPQLALILKNAPEAFGRRSAASALRNTASRTALAPLSTALNDPDFEVRYYGVIGLAEITGQNDWRPLLEEFQNSQQKYLSHWREWVQVQNK